MLDQLQRHVATGSDSIAYGPAELQKAAASGAIKVLLTRTACDASLTSIVAAHGGLIVPVRDGASEALDMLQTVALLHYPFSTIDTEEEEECSCSSEPSPCDEPGKLLPLPLPCRTLTHYAPSDAPCEPLVEPAASSAKEELELLAAMFGSDRKLRMLAPFDGSRFLLHVDAGDASEATGYLILEFSLPDAYPAAPPVVTAPFGSAGNRVLSEVETAAAAASCCAEVGVGAPMLFAMYDAAREWLVSRSIEDAA